MSRIHNLPNYIFDPLLDTDEYNFVVQSLKKKFKRHISLRRVVNTEQKKCMQTFSYNI